MQVAYDARETHRVLPVASDERFSLALWFTEDPSHSEDTRLLAQLPGARAMLALQLLAQLERSAGGAGTLCAAEGACHCMAGGQSWGSSHPPPGRICAQSAEAGWQEPASHRIPAAPALY
jgi:hypothetical protein